MLQEMEIGDEEDEDNISMLEVQIETGNPSEAQEEIVFSPNHSLNASPAPLKQHKWGPVQAQRKSSRIDIGGRTILEIAVG